VFQTVPTQVRSSRFSYEIRAAVIAHGGNWSATHRAGCSRSSRHGSIATAAVRSKAWTHF